VRAQPVANNSGRAERKRHAPTRQLLSGHYAAISGHCIYCGGFSSGRLCRAHTDLPTIDPTFAPTTQTLTR